ncbi:hypothetical protein JCM3766R1_000309 [Sporobolomyces carnicolor]
MSAAQTEDPPRPRPDARVPYKIVDGHAIHLEVYLPPRPPGSGAEGGLGRDHSTSDSETTHARPVFVWIHGGGWFDGAASDWSLPNLVPVLERGWAFVSLDYRLVPQVTLADCVGDIQDGCEFIRSGQLDEALGKRVVDGTRLAVSGSSAGGALAVYASYTLSTPPRVVFPLYAGSDLSFPSFHAKVAFPSGQIEFSEVESHLSPTSPVVSHSPAEVDFSTMIAQGRTRACFWALQEGKAIELAVPGVSSSSDPDERDRLLERFVASNLVGPMTPPTVLVHGTGDMMIPFEISRKLFTRLQEQGVDTVLLEEPGANHGFDLLPGVIGDKDKMKVFGQALDFVAKYL